MGILPSSGCAVSSVVEHHIDTVGVTGSKPVSRTIPNKFIFTFESAAPNCYVAAMSRKASDSHHGLNDVIGFALLAVAVLLIT